MRIRGGGMGVMGVRDGLEGSSTRPREYGGSGWEGGGQCELLLSRSERRGAEHRNAVRCVLAE